ncbi:uncharacterized protein si:dkey-234i14.6 isoform X2 [Coregonus clupeaformis]|uniref:uncharacterized protein si:dkey-234i14.6 isoform X2 n=1 Tax=Coregonus clupeaformis TaxID=59861 RepID=UPI001BE05E2F|nr:uncharacterized protein si:dkey-234i14.6 isoform X2 [Coregonus clupeaformis]
MLISSHSMDGLQTENTGVNSINNENTEEQYRALAYDTALSTLVAVVFYVVVKVSLDGIRQWRARISVLIVGSGPVGLTAALVAVRSGKVLKLTLLDERYRTALLCRPQQIALDPRSVEFLLKLGVDFDNMEGCWHNEHFFTKIGVFQEYLLSILEQKRQKVEIKVQLGTKVPTPEIRAHSLFFDLSAYGVEALREPKSSAVKPGFHLKIYGTFRNRYMALVCPASDTKMVRFLRHTANSSIMKNIFHQSFNAYKTDIEPRLNDLTLHHMQCSRRLFEIQLSHRRVSAAYIEGDNVAVTVEGEAVRVLNFDTGCGVNLGMRGLESLGTFIYRTATAVDQNDMLEALSTKIQHSRQVAETFRQTGLAHTMFE